jgi:hypothetical protein
MPGGAVASPTGTGAYPLDAWNEGSWKRTVEISCEPLRKGSGNDSRRENGSGNDSRRENGSGKDSLRETGSETRRGVGCGNEDGWSENCSSEYGLSVYSFEGYVLNRLATVSSFMPGGAASNLASGELCCRLTGEAGPRAARDDASPAHCRGCGGERTSW